MTDNKFGAHGHWGRAHALDANVPQGGAAGPLLGPNRRVLHHWCVDAYNANKGHCCLHCGRPVLVGLEVEGLGRVHKGYCYAQLQVLLDEQRREELAAHAQAEIDHFSCYK